MSGPPGKFVLREGAAAATVPPPLAGTPGGGNRNPADVPAGGSAPDGRPRRPPAEVRSAERRNWSAGLLTGPTAGLVVHGIGGAGKSVLAAEIVARAARLEPGRRTEVIRGEVSADGFVAALAAAVRRDPHAPEWGGIRAEALTAADRVDLPWEHRLALLREHALSQVPVLICLDDFDDNLAEDPRGWAVRDPALAVVLARWAEEPGLAKLLVTSRHTFSLPGASARALAFRHLGPLSRAGARALAGSLPALSRLSEAEVDRAWRLLGGHPGAMAYLDSLLAAGRAPFAATAERLAGAIEARTGHQVRAGGLVGMPTGLAPAAAEEIALVAADVLLGELCALLRPAAEGLLIGASVYRAPVGCHFLLLPGAQRSGSVDLAGLAAECEAAGLLEIDRSQAPPTLFVPRWTASELHRRLAAARRGGEIAGAHRRAAGFWQRRVTVAPQDGHAVLEAGYHLLRASGQGRGQPDRRVAPGAAPLAGGARRRLLLGSGAAAAAVAAVVAAVAVGNLRPGGSAARPPAPAAEVRAEATASALSRRAAGWAAQQISRGAIVACDPAMCATLRRQGIAPPYLLVLWPSTPDPLGSDVVMATAAVRSQFGARLTSVYAPTRLACFGSGQTRIEVRAMAPDGAAAYRAALAADLAARRRAGALLARNPRLTIAAAARRDLVAGRVDSRLLITLAEVASAGPARIMAFGDSGPGAGTSVPLREMALAPPSPGTAGLAALRAVLTFVRAQRPPFLPARAAIVPGTARLPVLHIEFAAPSPVGLLQTQPPLQRRGS